MRTIVDNCSPSCKGWCDTFKTGRESSCVSYFITSTSFGDVAELVLVNKPSIFTYNYLVCASGFQPHKNWELKDMELWLAK